MPNSPRIFICYAHADNENPDPSKRWLDRLLEMLEPLELQGMAQAWSDQRLELGTEWHEEIQDTLDQVVAAVLLVSSAFLKSKYIRNSEVPVLLKQAKEQGVVILPIVLRPCLYKETKFTYRDGNGQEQKFSLASLQSPNSVSNPLNSMEEHEQDEALLKVAQRLLKIVSSPTSAIEADIQEVAVTALPTTEPSQTPANPSIPVTWQIVFDSRHAKGGRFADTNDTKRSLRNEVVNQIRDLSGDSSLSHKSEKFSDGSIFLSVRGSQEGFHKIEALFASGQLSEISGKQIEQVKLVTAPLSTPNQPSANWQQRLKLSQLLYSLPGPQFEQILFTLNAPRENIPGSSAPPGERVAKLLEWAESRIGCGLDHLEAVLDAVINPQ